MAVQACTLVQQIVSSGQQTAATNPSLAPFGLMYAWHGSYYLGGAAHQPAAWRRAAACMRLSGDNLSLQQVHPCFQQIGAAGAHGLAGILHTLLLACNCYTPAELLPDGDLLALVERATLALVEATFPSGNLPSSVGKEADK